MIGSKRRRSGLVDPPVTGGVKFRCESDKTCSSGPAYPTNTLGLAATRRYAAKVRSIARVPRISSR